MCHYVGFSHISSQLCEYRITKYYGYYKPCIMYKMPIHTNTQHTIVSIIISTFHVLHKTHLHESDVVQYLRSIQLPYLDHHPLQMATF